MKYPTDYVEMIEKGFKKIFFVDLETTGLDFFRNEILTASVSVCDYETLAEIDAIELKFKPENLQFWSPEAEKVHGIKLQQALDFPENKLSSAELMSFLHLHKCDWVQPLVSHSLNFRGGYFDQFFLSAHFMKQEKEFELRRICGISQSTIDYAKQCLKLENYKLSTLASYYKIELNHHDAKSDREACQKLYKIFRSL